MTTALLTTPRGQGISDVSPCYAGDGWSDDLSVLTGLQTSDFTGLKSDIGLAQGQIISSARDADHVLAGQIPDIAAIASRPGATVRLTVTVAAIGGSAGTTGRIGFTIITAAAIGGSPGRGALICCTSRCTFIRGAVIGTRGVIRGTIGARAFAAVGLTVTTRGVVIIIHVIVVAASTASGIGADPVGVTIRAAVIVGGTGRAAHVAAVALAAITLGVLALGIIVVLVAAVIDFQFGLVRMIHLRLAACNGNQSKNQHQIGFH